MRETWVFLLLLIILINHPSSGQEEATSIDVISMTHDITLKKNTSSIYYLRVIFENSDQNLTQLDLQLELIIFNVSVVVDGNPAAVQVNQESGKSVLTIVPIFVISSNLLVDLEISAKFDALYDMVEENSYQFFFNWDSSWKSDNISVVVSLPLHASLHEENGNYNIFPSTAQFTSDGKLITLVWNSLSNLSGVNTQLFVQFDTASSSNNLPMSQNNLLIIWIMGLSLLVATSLLVYIYWKNKETKDEIMETKVVTRIKPVILSPQELDILKIISEHEGKLPQSDLTTILGVSRARVSQWLSKFEERGLIKKYKIGRQNYVSLEEDVDLNDLKDNSS